MNWKTISAVLFDLDGVLTPTAVVHMHAWDKLFTAVLAEYNIAEPYTDSDYHAYVDGKPRYDGVYDFLVSRSIELPWGDPTDDPGQATVCGLGNRKNMLFNRVLESDGVRPYPGSVAFLDECFSRGVATAVVSSSRNARAVLPAAGLAERFTHVVDGEMALEEGLPGKPDPATYLRGAELVGVDPSAAAVIEDAISGVQAGRRGNFGFVVGVDRGVGVASLKQAGADTVVTDLAELI